MNYYIIKLKNHHLLDTVKYNLPEEELPFGYDPEEDIENSFIPGDVWRRCLSEVVVSIEEKLIAQSLALTVIGIDKQKLTLIGTFNFTTTKDMELIRKIIAGADIPGIIEEISSICLKDVKACLIDGEGAPLYKNYTKYKRINNLTFVNQLLEFDNYDNSKHLVSDTRTFYIMEGLLGENGKKRDWFSIACLLGNRNYMNEMNRIIHEKSCSTKLWIPAHYLFNTKKSKERDHGILALGEKLYKAGRIHNPRLTIVDIASNKLEIKKLNSLFESAKGGCIVLEFLTECQELPLDKFLELYRLIRQYRHMVVTILCLSGFKEELPAFNMILKEMPWVTFSENMLYNPSEANVVLRYLATKDGFSRKEAPRFEAVSNKEETDKQGLYRLYDQWYQSKATKVYSCYKDIANSLSLNINKDGIKKTAREQLGEMIGLSEAKKLLDRVIQKHNFDKQYGSRLNTEARSSRHMIFMGNPGTAKTTVARLFARCLHEEGILTKGELIECGRADLIGEYVGWTAKSVVKKFREASGCVLFIDEAYSLCDEKRGGFADEAISTIVREMENHRDDVIVIFAGYKTEMQEFINRNPGLCSRIPFILNFKDYTPKELVDIAKLCAKENDRAIEKKAEGNLFDKFSEVVKTPQYGNGRYVRNVVEAAIDEQAKRIMCLYPTEASDKELKTLKLEDFSKSLDVSRMNTTGESNERRKIGFTLSDL